MFSNTSESSINTTFTPTLKLSSQVGSYGRCYKITEATFITGSLIKIAGIVYIIEDLGESSCCFNYVEFFDKRGIVLFRDEPKWFNKEEAEKQGYDEGFIPQSSYYSFARQLEMNLDPNPEFSEETTKIAGASA